MEPRVILDSGHRDFDLIIKPTNPRTVQGILRYYLIYTVNEAKRLT